MPLGTRRAKEFVVELINRPGELGKLAQVLGKEDVNILGIGAVGHDGVGIAHIVTDDPAATETTLQASGYTMDVREALLVDLANEPGELGRVANTLGEAGVNIEATYVTTGGPGDKVRLALSCEDAQAGQAALEDL